MKISQNSDLLKEHLISEVQDWFVSNPKTKDNIRRINELVIFEDNTLVIHAEALDGQYVMKFFNRAKFKQTATILADKITEVLKQRMKTIELTSYQLHIKVKYLSYLHEKRIELHVPSSPDQS
jgi:hypothetical protein